MKRPPLIREEIEPLGIWMGREMTLIPSSMKKRQITVGFYVKLPKPAVNEIRSRAKRLAMTQANLILRWLLLATAADKSRSGK